MSGGLRVVHLDGWCAVIDKPGGLLSVPGRGPDKQDSVVSRLRSLLPWCLAQPAVHRLDMATSGLMVLALPHRSIATCRRSSPGARWPRNMWPCSTGGWTGRGERFVWPSGWIPTTGRARCTTRKAGKKA